MQFDKMVVFVSFITKAFFPLCSNSLSSRRTRAVCTERRKEMPREKLHRILINECYIFD